jgi:DNA-binding HxlR family transcriptional regulator
MAGQAKGKKKGRDEKEEKEEWGDVGAVLHQLTEAVALLRGDVDSLRKGATVAASAYDSQSEVGFVASAVEGKQAIFLANAVDDNDVVRLGYAVSSVPKVALMRHLLLGGELPAAELGEKATLTTGSLYHHLRELIHAGVVSQPTKHRYALTEPGRQLLLTLMHITASSQK